MKEQCNRCGGPNGTQDGYELFAANVCSLCWHELNSLALKAADRAARVDVAKLHAAFEARCKANNFETPVCDDCQVKPWEHQVYREKDFCMARLCDGCFSDEVAPPERELEHAA